MAYKIRRSSAGIQVTATADDKFAFHGVTPVVQPAAAAQAAVAETATESWGSTEVDAVNNLKTLLNRLRTDMIALGLIKGAALIIGLALLLAMPAAAQVVIVDFSCTNRIVTNATTTVSLGNAVDIEKNKNVGIEFRGGNADDNAHQVTLRFARSADGTYYETTNVIIWTITVPGTATVVTNIHYTNLPETAMGTAKFIKIASIYCDTPMGNITNVYVRAVKARKNP